MSLRAGAARWRCGAKRAAKSRRAERSLLDASGAEAPSASVAGSSRVVPRVAAAPRSGRDVDGARPRGPRAFVDHELIGTVCPSSGGIPRCSAQAPAARDARASAAAGNHPAAETRFHVAVRALDGRRARADRAGRTAPARGRRLDYPEAPASVWDGWTSGRLHWSGRGASPCWDTFSTERGREARAAVAHPLARSHRRHRASSGLRPINLRELWTYRELLYFSRGATSRCGTSRPCSARRGRSCSRC